MVEWVVFRTLTQEAEVCNLFGTYSIIMLLTYIFPFLFSFPSLFGLV